MLYKNNIPYYDGISVFRWNSVFKTILYNGKIRITGALLWIKDPDLVFSWIRVTQKDRIRIRIRNTGPDSWQVQSYMVLVLRSTI